MSWITDGPWLTNLKEQVRAGAPDNTPIRVHWRTRNGAHDEMIALGELKAKVLEFVPGRKVCYVTDVADNPRNREALARFLCGADLLFIESVFLYEDANTPSASRISPRALLARSRERLP